MKRRQSMSMKHVPEEVIWEILSNLPVKSLLRFKHVSKSWRSLISSPEFAKDHLNKSNSDLTHHTLIARLYVPGVGICFRSCSLKSLHDEPDQHPMIVSTWDHLNRDPQYPFRILGSCNGIILINIKWCGLFLWNPSTNDLKNIPCSQPQEEEEQQQPQEEEEEEDSQEEEEEEETEEEEELHREKFSNDGSSLRPWEDLGYAFGYDDFTDDNKIVEFDRDTKDMKIYSARTDSWKNIDNFEETIALYSDVGKFVNGKLHWLGAKEDSVSQDSVRVIVSLSLEEGKEKYHVMALPEYLSNNDQSKAELEILGGYLSLICDNCVVWVMKKYGVEESWTKVCILSDLYVDCASHWDNKYIGATPFWATENGDVFVLFGKSKVVVCNGKNKLREYRIGKDNELQYNYELQALSVGGYEPTVYVESLVSLYK